VTITAPPPPSPPSPNTPPNSAKIVTVPSAGGPVGTVLSDTAYVTGISNPASGDSVTFGLYSDSSCTTVVQTLGSSLLSGPSQVQGTATWTATSPGSGYAPGVAQTYYWGVSFNAVNDPDNLSSSLICGEPVTITASQGTKGAHSTPTPPTPVPTPTPKPESKSAGGVLGASTPATPGTGADISGVGLLAVLAFALGGILILAGIEVRRRSRA
jgi:hypothetical protein